jgi:transcriptional regulator with XRE-family HTH domain
MLAPHYTFGMLTPEQCRMARAALRWTVQDVAKLAGVSPTTVNQYEMGHTAPNASTLRVLRMTFEEAGIVFIDDGEGSGVRLVKPITGKQ